MYNHALVDLVGNALVVYFGFVGRMVVNQFNCFVGGMLLRSA